MKYLALTIGPLIKTLSNTRKTRELWGASYLFSRIMRDIICKLLQEGPLSVDNILSPSSEMHNWNRFPPTIKEGIKLKSVESLGVGLFPDRMFVKLEQEETEHILSKARKATNDVLEDLSKVIDDTLEKEYRDYKSSLPYLEQYFQCYFLVKELEEDKNIIFELSPLLDALELQGNFPLVESPKYLSDFLFKINSARPLIEEAFQEYYRDAHPSLSLQKFGFDSTVEISVRELGYIGNDTVQDTFSRYLETYLLGNGVLRGGETRSSENKALPDRKDELANEKQFIRDLASDVTPLNINGDPTKFKDLFKTYHKYIAIVQADGDNVGNILGKVANNTGELKEFSKKLNKFSLHAAQMIHEYGGSVIYAGGDDLLFFAPISMVQARSNHNGDPKGDHILHLLELLDHEFNNEFQEYREFNPSLSFGVSISYYAFPMGEALEQALTLLRDTAKNVQGKNAIALSIQKHSGNIFGGIYQLHSDLFSQFNALQFSEIQDNETEILQTATHKLYANKQLLSLIGQNADQVHNFMENSFNEPVHLPNDQLKPYLQWVDTLIPEVYTLDRSILSLLPGNTTEEKYINQLFGLLRTKSFLKGEEI